MRVADALGIRTGIGRAAIDANTARRAAKNFPALRGKFFRGQSVVRGLRGGLGLRCMWRGQNDQTRNQARENGKNSCPHHHALSVCRVPNGRQSLRLKPARQPLRLRHRLSRAPLGAGHPAL